MRRRLVALLSLVGLANSATPACTQVSTGSSQLPDTKTESKVKLDKTQQESAATKNDSTVKLKKNIGEQKAGQDVVSEKIGADHIVHKHIAGVKYEKQTKETNAGKTQATIKLTNADAASKDAAKMTKAKTESTAAGQESIGKGEQKHWETSAVKNEVVQKGRKAGSEHADAASKDAAKLSKTKNEYTSAHTHGVKGGRKAGAEQDALTVKQKIAAESKGTKNAEWIKAGKKQTDKQGPVVQKPTPEPPK